MTKRVVIDATSWSNRRGYGRFIRGLLPPLLVRPSHYRFELLVDEATAASDDLPTGVPVHVVETSQAATQAASHDSSRSVADLLAMSFAARRLKPDALVFPTVYTYFPVLGPLGPRFPRFPWPGGGRCRVVVGLMDTIAERYPDLVFPKGQGRRFWNAKVLLSRLQASRILTISDHAREQLVSTFGLPEDRIDVVEAAPDPVFRALDDSERDESVMVRQGLHRGDRYLVYLGGINPHKNLVALVHSLAEVRKRPGFDDLQLRFVGDIERESFTPGAAPLRDAIADLGLEDVARFTGFLGDEEVVQLLNQASALVQPSFAEGYGLPSVEGAACGLPVVATSNSPLPQLLEGGGRFVDPHRPEDLTAALVDLLGDEEGRAAAAGRALERARRLTWENSADQFLAQLDRLFR
ncbi:MAG: glycosyltransferase family 1 protein [Acidobacteriota bacterium]